MCSARCGARAAVALQHVNLLLVVFAGACLATGARLRWDPSLYVAVRELLPAEYRVLAAAVPGAGAALLALAHLAVAGAAAPAAHAAPHRRAPLLYTYAALMSLAVVLEAALLGWVWARVAQFLDSAAAEQMQELLATRDHLQPLLQHLARWHPLPDRLAALIQEAEQDLPWNGYVAAAAAAVLAALQLLAAALALAAACARAPDRERGAMRARSRTPLSASRVSLVDSFGSRSGASSIKGASVPGSPVSARGEWASLRTKYKNGRIVPL